MVLFVYSNYDNLGITFRCPLVGTCRHFKNNTRNNTFSCWDYDLVSAFWNANVINYQVVIYLQTSRAGLQVSPYSYLKLDGATIVFLLFFFLNSWLQMKTFKKSNAAFSPPVLFCFTSFSQELLPAWQLSWVRWMIVIMPHT